MGGEGHEVPGGIGGEGRGCWVGWGMKKVKEGRHKEEYVGESRKVNSGQNLENVNYFKSTWNQSPFPLSFVFLEKMFEMLRGGDVR